MYCKKQKTKKTSIACELTHISCFRTSVIIKKRALECDEQSDNRWLQSCKDFVLNMSDANTVHLFWGFSVHHSLPVPTYIFCLLYPVMQVISKWYQTVSWSLVTGEKEVNE